jgi:hypothetical protein
MAQSPDLKTFFEWLDSHEGKKISLDFLRTYPAQSRDIECLYRWLEIRHTNGQDIGDVIQLKIDADHSGLLRRLLKGEEPTPEAPPLAYSYSWVDVIQKGRAEAYEVYEPHPESAMCAVAPQPSIVIDQTFWPLLEKLGEDDWIVTYRTPDIERIARERADGTWAQNKGGGIPMKNSTSRWRVYTTGPNPRIPDHKAWMVERVQ